MAGSKTIDRNRVAVGLAPDNAAVLKHMDMYQGIITRMASNSAACKKWGIPLISAILGFIVSNQVVSAQKETLVLLALFPIGIFYFLDSYYLMLENRFREGFDESAKAIRNGTFKQGDLFKMHPKGSEAGYWLKSFTSFATWPVYFGLLALLVFCYKVVA